MDGLDQLFVDADESWVLTARGDILGLLTFLVDKVGPYLIHVGVPLSQRGWYVSPNHYLLSMLLGKDDEAAVRLRRFG